MAQYFDEERWRLAFRKQDWYLEIYDEFRALEQQAERSQRHIRASMKEEIYAFVEGLLAESAVLLGTKGIDWDRERQPITTVVVHHTQERTGLTLKRLNAMHLLRLYAARYAADNLDPDCRGQAIWSNHLVEDQPVFLWLSLALTT